VAGKPTGMKSPEIIMHKSEDNIDMELTEMR
jgi:hypothetical protein